MKAIFFFFLFLFFAKQEYVGKTCEENIECEVEGVGALLCGVEGTCVQCVEDVECQAGESYLKRCVESVEDNLMVCQNKGLWIPHWREIVATAVGVFGGCFASAAGIGGGGIYLPVYMIVAGYEATMAAPLSTITIFGSAISNVALLLLETHPHPKIKKPRIDYDLALILEPIILAGTMIGVLFNVLFPKWLTLIVLVLTLSVSSIRTLMKGKKQLKLFKDARKHHHHGEKELEDHDHHHDHHHDHDHDHDHDHEHKHEHDHEHHHHEEQEVNLDELKTDDDSSLDELLEAEDTGLTSTDVDEDEVSDALDELVEGGEEVSDASSEKEEGKKEQGWLLSFVAKYENWRVQPIQLFVLFCVWIFVFLVTFAKGSKKTPSMIGIDACGETAWAYWLVTVVSIPVLVVTSMSVGGVLNTIWKKRTAAGFKYYAGETVQWTAKNSYLLPLFFFAAGIAAGLLGIGGGMVIAPLFIEIGVKPEVGSSTSALMILFTSSATVIQYFMMGSLSLDYSLWFGLFGFFSSFVGRLVIGYVVKKLKSGFIITLIIGFTIMGATILMGTIGVYDVVIDAIAVYNGENWMTKFWFKWIC